MEKALLIDGNTVMKHRVSPQKSEKCLQLTGSQVNLTSRVQKNAIPSGKPGFVCKSRPYSAFPCYGAHLECKSNWKRPMSADNEISFCRMTNNRSNHMPLPNKLDFTFSEGEVADLDPNFKHCYTYLSSNLLRSLIRDPWNSECSESLSNSSSQSHSEKSLGCQIREIAQKNSDLSFYNIDGNDDGIGDTFKNTPKPRDKPTELILTTEGEAHIKEGKSKKFVRKTEKSKLQNKTREERSELRDIKFQKWFLGGDKDIKAEEKTVRFSKNESIGVLPESLIKSYDSKKEEICSDLSSAPKSNNKSDYNPENYISKNSPAFDNGDCSDDEAENEISKSEGFNNSHNNVNDESADTVENCTSNKRQASEETEVPEQLEREIKNEKVCSAECPFSCCNTEFSSGCDLKSRQTKEAEIEQRETEKQEKKCCGKESEGIAEENEPVKDFFVAAHAREKHSNNLENMSKDSTLDEIVNIINVLEQEESKFNLEEVEPSETISNKNNRQPHDIYSYLDEVEKSSQEAIKIAKSNFENIRAATQSVFSNTSSVPRLEDLLNKNVLELAHEVLTLKFQIEDQSSGIKLLQSTISEMKDAAKMAKSNYEDEIFKITNDAETAVQRHQKFIKQLLQEKKTLNEKVEKLVEDLKAGEERHQRNLKTIEERHAIEIQRVKETQAVAEKLKREKWIDTKTQKIKEMTVKGLEPELSRMAARQQQEITDLRNLHRSELEAVELRAARRTTELLDQLRSELAKDKEEAILRETNALRAKLDKQFEEERNRMEHEMRKLKEERRREKEILENKEAQMQDIHMEMKRAMEREKERERQRMLQEFQEQIEATKRRHQIEIKSVRDTLELEKEAWMNNYKKQQNAKLMEREAELHHQYKRERDRDIELVIERLENEATQAQQELNQAAENKFKRMKEKFEQEIKEIEATEAILKMKLSEAKAQLLEKDDKIAELNSDIHHLQSDLNHLRKLCEEMSAERGNLKQIIEKEFQEHLTEAKRKQEELNNQIFTIQKNHALELAKKDQLAIQVRAEAQQELNQVYNRVKITMNKKEEALKILREQHKTVLERCSHLEELLENQRKNLLLK